MSSLAVRWSAGSRMHGFVLEEVRPLEEIRTVAYRLSHEKSGARLLYLHADDPENLFAIAFRTPPLDDTGLTHILEHAVLCGSERYPVKDPFVELLKTSLATFLNAMTGADKTIYPCASMNEKDFFNLVSVYCDAVFHPRLTEMHFKQEGHHLAFAIPHDISSPLILKGIVYNEMKGIYSDLDGILQREEMRSLFPDSVYGRDIGGDPDVIPTLTYEAFRRYHATYYHPSNAWIFIYGRIELPLHLAFLDPILSRFDRISIDTSIVKQPRWTAPRRATIPYPISPHESTKGRAAVTLQFLCHDLTDAVKTLAMVILSRYLLDHAGSPLRKALIDSKLGEELTHSGYVAHSRETYFTVGLKQTEPDRAEAIRDLVFEVCRREVERGLDREKLATAFHQIELRSREIGTLYPLSLMDRAFGFWLYDADPTWAMRIGEHLNELRRRWEEDPSFFASLLREAILENPHYTLLTFVPDPDYFAKKEASFAATMAARKAAMSQEELRKIAEEAAALEAAQAEPNSPEALATLPRLRRSDVSPDPIPLPTTIEEVAGRPLLVTDVFANGLTYLRIAFDVRDFEEDLFDDLSFFADAVTEMGAAGLDYATMAEREAAACEGIYASLSVEGRVEMPDYVQPQLLLACHGLDTRLPAMLSVLEDRLLRCDFRDRKRLAEVIQQGRVHRREDLLPSGHHYAAQYAMRRLSRNGALSERLLGITSLRRFERLASDLSDTQLDRLIERLERIQDRLLCRGRLVASLVGSEESQRIFRDWWGRFLGSLRDEAPPVASLPSLSPLPAYEGIATATDVSFVAMTFPSVPADHPDAPGYLLLALQLTFDYLWQNIRVKQGAYGVRANYYGGTGMMGLMSFRDPCILETLEVFRGTADHILYSLDRSPEAVEQMVIGTIKTMDKPIRPSQAVSSALLRYLTGETEAFRRRFRSRLLGIMGEDLVRIGEGLREAMAKASVCVIANPEKLSEASQSLPHLHVEVL